MRVLGAVVICVLLAACGSTSSSTSSPSASASSSSSGSITASSATSSATAPATTTTSAPGDPSGKLSTLPTGQAQTGTLPTPAASPTRAAEQRYLTAVFNDAQHFWQQEFSQAGVQYLPARLTLFTNVVHSGCGAQADTGPFYCPANRGVYLDLSFFDLLARQAGIGRFGPAYIVGHELGHHIQHLIGVFQSVATLDHRDPSGANVRSVAVELQADCLAGVWVHSSHARGQVTEADLGDALNTAKLVGDDFQQHSAGRVVDSSMWTHGSSAQRQQWLTTGFRSGRPDSCDTFSGSTP